jgi:drug/metabolite transporter (DMT)-like permease
MDVSKFPSKLQVSVGGFLIVLATLLWATDLFCRRDLLQKLDPVSLVWLEHLIVLVIMSPLFLSSLFQLFKLNRSYFFSLLFIGVVGSGLGTVAFSFAFGTINPVIPIILQKLQPFVAITAAHIFLKETHPAYFGLAAAVAILGALLVSHPYYVGFVGCVSDFSACVYSSGQGTPPVEWIGGLAVMASLVAVFAWGFSTVLGRFVSQKLQPKDITFLRYFFGFVGLFLWLFLVGSSQKMFVFFEILVGQPVLGIKLLYMALVIGLLALMLYYKGIKRVPAKLASLLELFYPVFSLILAYLFLDQSLTWIQILGMMCIVSASLYCTQRGFK